MSSLQASRGMRSFPVEILQRIFEAEALDEIDRRQESWEVERLKMAAAAEEEDTVLSIIYDSEDSDDSEDSSEPEKGLRRLQRPFFAVIVSHVCRTWRQIALATPSLWTWITFGSEKSDTMPTTFLSRSGICPLDMVLSYEVPLDSLTDDENEKPEMVRDVEGRAAAGINLMESHVHRLRSLRVCLSSDDLMRKLLQSLDDCPGAPLLQSLLLDNDDFPERSFHGQYLPASLFSGHVPRLEKLRIYNVSLDLRFIIPRSIDPFIPSSSSFSNVRRLTLCSFDVEHDAFRDVLAHCPKLEKLFLEDFELLSPDRKGSVRPILHELKELHVVDSNLSMDLDLCAVFSSFYAPNLKELKLISNEDIDNGDAIFELANPSLPCKLRSTTTYINSNENFRSSTAATHDADSDPYQFMISLERLELTDVWCANEVALRFLQKCKKVKELELAGPQTVEAFFSQLHSSASGHLACINSSTGTLGDFSLLCPSLTHLDIQASTHNLKDYLRIRLRVGAGIETLTLCDAEVLSEKQIDELREYVAEIHIINADDSDFSDEDTEDDELWVTTDEESVSDAED